MTRQNIAVILIFAVFLMLEFRAISTGNYAGQDFVRHISNIKESAQDPLKAFETPIARGRSPVSLYHFIGGRIYNIVGPNYISQTMAILNLLANLGALFLFYLFICKIIQSEIIRLSCFLFITFLPLNVIVSLVVAPDALTSLFFISICFGILKIAEGLERGRDVGFLSWAVGLLMVVSFINKFTFVFCLVGVFLFLLGLFYCRKIGPRQWVGMNMALVVAPLILSIWAFFGFIKHQTPHFGGKIPVTDHIDYHHMVFLSPNDKYLLAAPYFIQPAMLGDKVFCPLQENNYFSFPAMLHLAIFTDVLNIDEPIMFPVSHKMPDVYYNRVRTRANQNRMAMAVKSGLLFSVGLLVTIVWLIIYTLSLLRKRQVNVSVLILALMSLTVFLGFMVYLPMTILTCYGGYWMPRYIFPAILMLFVLLFVVLDKRIVNRWPWARFVVLGAVVFQSALHISFLYVAPPIIQIPK